MGQRLQRFAQAHVVGQNAAQAVLAQELQPVQALLLVGPQAGLQGSRHAHLGQLLLAGELLHQLAQELRARPLRALTECTERGARAQRIEARQLEAVD